jgi:hypothetical protein
MDVSAQSGRKVRRDTCPGDSRSACAPPDREDEIGPLGLARVFPHEAENSVGDDLERVRLNSVDNDDTGMRTTGLGPVAEQPREVGHIEGDQNSALRHAELENLLVLQTLGVGLIREGADVVPGIAEEATDPRTRQLRVEK